MAKTLCKLKKALRDDPDEYAKLVQKSRFYCTKCGRAARKKKNLCSPQKV